MLAKCWQLHFICGDQAIKQLPVHIHNFDPSLAPAGKTLLTLMLDSDYEYWKKLSEDPERYKEEKEQIVDQMVAQLDRRFPGLAAQVEMRDVATPMTYERPVTGRVVIRGGSLLQSLITCA